MDEEYDDDDEEMPERPMPLGETQLEEELKKALGFTSFERPFKDDEGSREGMARLLGFKEEIDIEHEIEERQRAFRQANKMI